MIGFGWLSRRFERQADLFGARCVMPEASGCHVPCSVHLEGHSTNTGSERVCATAAALFASALDRVACVSGIPHEERSWRHSSVGSRIRFLHSLAGDPARAIRFERIVRRAKAVLLAAAVVGAAGSLYYWSVTPMPALMRWRAENELPLQSPCPRAGASTTTACLLFSVAR
jgi:STE24 endopeptidase